jgi:hypothetical protein
MDAGGGDVDDGWTSESPSPEPSEDCSALQKKSEAPPSVTWVLTEKDRTLLKGLYIDPER